LLRIAQFSKGYVILVRYWDCTNLEGRKILVAKGEYAHPAMLDPHFSESWPELIARFRPDDDGWEAACRLAASLSD
jgi:hypothetical protein